MAEPTYHLGHLRYYYRVNKIVLMNLVKNFKIDCPYLLFCAQENKSTYKIIKSMSGRTDSIYLKLNSFSAPLTYIFISPDPFSVLHLSWIMWGWLLQTVSWRLPFPLTWLRLTNEENEWEIEIGGQRTKLGCFPTNPSLPGHNWKWLDFLGGEGGF